MFSKNKNISEIIIPEISELDKLDYVEIQVEKYNF
jgi:hypothetical protein